MENITKEVKGFHENNTKAITTIKQEQFENNSKGPVIKIITKIVKNQVRTMFVRHSINIIHMSYPQNNFFSQSIH